MRSLAARRALNLSLLAIASLVVGAWYAVYRLTLGDPRIFAGWCLFGSVVLLALYNTRKRLPFLPLGLAATWLQLHIYVGLLSVLFFVLHAGVALPSGTFETLLAVLYGGVAATGIIGLFLSRSIPPRLARRGEEVIYERIPVLRRELRRRAEAVVLESLTRTRAKGIADYYHKRLYPFFSRPRNLLGHVLGSTAARRALQEEMTEFSTGLRKQDKPFLDRIEDLVVAKDDLDFHWANQAVLKYWLFLHIPLTYALFLFVLVHVVLVYAFGAAG